jgi:acyl-CoA thioesterase FadM
VRLHPPGRTLLRATIEEVQVHVDLHSGSAAPLPDWIRAAIDKAEGVLVG